MKRTIMGFSQKAALDLCLDIPDLVVLRWFVDFKATSEQSAVDFSDGRYFRVDFFEAKKDLPIMKFEKRGIEDTLGRLVDRNVLTNRICKCGSMAYSFGGNYRMLCGDSEPINKVCDRYVKG